MDNKRNSPQSENNEERNKLDISNNPTITNDDSTQSDAGGSEDLSSVAGFASARTLATVAIIGGPVSLIIGGVVLSVVSLICGVVSLAKIKKLARKPVARQLDAQAVRRTAAMGIALSCIALALNVVGVLLMVPLLMEAMNTGDYSAILGTELQGSVMPSDTNPWG